MPSPRQIREEITKKIIAALENDLLPWRRPWASNNAGQHSNALTKKAYRGVNPLLLQLHAIEHGFTSNWWATFNQWHELGCTVQRRPDQVEAGNWGCGLAVYIPITKKAEEPARDEDDEEVFWILKKFTVFNAEQVNGRAAEEFQAVETSGDVQPDYQPAEELILKSGADIRYGGNESVYRLPTPIGTWPNHTHGDYIQVPPKPSFINGSFYPTILHELGHWSEIRLSWDREKQGYAMGELIAEMAACFLAAELRIPNGEPLDNHAAYLKSWLEGMHGDPNYVFKASRQASKVCDFLLSFVKQDATEAKPALVEAA